MTPDDNTNTDETFETSFEKTFVKKDKAIAGPIEIKII
jgi:hypothetical protein